MAPGLQLSWAARPTPAPLRAKRFPRLLRAPGRSALPVSWMRGGLSCAAPRAQPGGRGAWWSQRAGNSGNPVLRPRRLWGLHGADPVNICNPLLPKLLSPATSQPRNPWAASGPWFLCIYNELWCIYVKIFFKIYAPFAYFPVCCGLQVSGKGAPEGHRAAVPRPPLRVDTDDLTVSKPILAGEMEITQWQLQSGLGLRILGLAEGVGEEQVLNQWWDDREDRQVAIYWLSPQSEGHLAGQHKAHSHTGRGPMGS